MSESGAFLAGIAAHLRAFADVNDVAESDIHVRITTADGRAIVLTRFSAHETHGGWGMVVGLAGGSPVAVVIRETHVVKAEFELPPQQPAPFGFGRPAPAR